MQNPRDGFFEPFELLVRELQSSAPAEGFLYVHNLGNTGDNLIHAATEYFLRSHSIKYRPLCSPSTPRWLQFLKLLLLPFLRLRYSHILYTGSGGFCRAHGHCLFLMKMFRLMNFDCTVLPSTYELRPPFQDRFKYWARDCTESFQRLDSKKFCHDLVFFFRPVLTRNFTGHPGHGELFCFRSDRERNEKNSIPTVNQDISLSTTGWEKFVSTIEEYESIYTDRLHVAIAGALLGKAVVLYANSYFKNKAVFDSSLSHFSHCTFEATRPNS